MEQKTEHIAAARERWFVLGAVSEGAVSDLAREMQAAGMYGARTPFLTVRFSVREIVSRLQRLA